MIYSEMTKKAIIIAFEARKGQFSRTGNPSIVRSFRIAEQMEDEVSVCVALLRGVVVDSFVSFDEMLKQGISETVIEILRLLVHDDSITFIEHIKKIKDSKNKVAISVELANLRDLYDLSKYDLFDNNVNEKIILRFEEAQYAIDLLSEQVKTKENKKIGSKSRKENIKSIIFLSHKSDDKKYGDALAKLIRGLGVNNNQIIYTSHPLHKIPLNANIYDFLRNKLGSHVFMIFLWSDKYLESPACLNEMGAAWLTKCDYTNIFVPNFSFDNPKFNECAVDTRKMGIILNNNQQCKASLIEFKNKILKLFNLRITESQWMVLLEEFLKEIS